MQKERSCYRWFVSSPTKLLNFCVGSLPQERHSPESAVLGLARVQLCWALGAGPAPWFARPRFYDVNDNFIDDEELAAVNAYHTEQQEKQKTGRTVKSRTQNPLFGVRPSWGPLKLFGLPVSGLRSVSSSLRSESHADFGVVWSFLAWT